MSRRAALGWLAAGAGALHGCQPQVSVPVQARWPDLPVRAPAPDLAPAGCVPPACSGPRLINLWALWCPPCRNELPALGRLAAALAPSGIRVEAIALAEDGFAVAEFLRRFVPGLAGWVVDPRAQGLMQLQVDALPLSFAVAADGRILERWLGARIWDAPQEQATVQRLLLGASRAGTSPFHPLAGAGSLEATRHFPARGARA